MVDVTPGADDRTAERVTIEVGSLPPAPETPPPAPDAPPSSSSAFEDWTEADLKELRGYIAMPYDLVATTQHAPYFAIDQDEADMIAKPLSRVIPVSWVRESKRRSPVIAALTALGAIYIVTSPRMKRLAEERARERLDRSDDNGSGSAASRPQPRDGGDAGHGPPAADDRGARTGVEGERPRLSVVDL